MQMSYSYYNASGKLISGAAANNHKTYTIHGGSVQQWLNTVTYAVTGLTLAYMMYKGIKNMGEVLFKK